MKTIKTIVACMAIGVALTACQSGREVNESFADIRAQFADPSKEYRPAPLWVWNSKVTKGDIDRMLPQFKEQGFGGAFVHPRPGLITEYISTEWYELFDYSVQRGKELGLNIWIYDENSYPSGFGGGHVPDRMPESYNQGVALRPIPTELLPDSASKMALVLRAVNGAGELEDITARVGDYVGKAGSYYMYEKAYYGVSEWTAGFSYVDLLVPGVTEKFMELTFAGYEKRNVADFGSTVPGIFTDEPEIVSPGGIRWTPDLFDAFQQQYGYDLKSKLALLHEEIGDFRKVRHDYYDLLNKLFLERFAMKMYDYCEQHKMKFTGHVWEHNWPNVNGVPDNMAFSACQQMPGIDMLFNQFNEESPYAQFGNIRSVKEVRSVANQMGRKQILCETYGGAGWETTFKDMKRLGDWQAALGVNYMNQHLSHMSFAGARKYDYPPMFTATAPWWDDYHVLNDYFSRLSMVMTEGEQYNDIVVLEPTTSIWMYSAYSTRTPSKKPHEIGNAFQKLVTAMERNQLEYDLACEDVIRRVGKLEGGRYGIGKRSYTTFVIPPLTENLQQRTFDLLREFAANGGRIVAFSKPSRLNGVQNAEVANFFAKAEIVEAADYSAQSLASLFHNEGVSYDVAASGKLYHQRRHYKDGQLFFFTNVDMDQPTQVTVAIDGASVVEMDAMNGVIYNYPYDRARKTFTVKLEPVESKILFVANGVLQGEERPTVEFVQTIAPVSPLVIERVKDNVLTLDNVDLTMNGSTTRGLHTQAAATQAFLTAGFPAGNPWQHKVQFKQKTVERDTFSTFGFTATYRFSAKTAGANFSGVRLGVERPHLYTIKVNGKEVTPGADYIYDTDTRLAPIGDVIREGENVVEVIAARFSVFAEIEPVYLVGNFSVEAGDKLFAISPARAITSLGDFKAAGCPFYPYAMSYSREFRVTKEGGKRFAVSAPDFHGTMAEVYVNGTKAGVIFSNPFTLDVTDQLAEGVNTIDLRVVGGMENLIGPFYAPLTGLTGPGSFRRGPEIKGPADYRFSPYGLFSEFILRSS